VALACPACGAEHAPVDDLSQALAASGDKQRAAERARALADAFLAPLGCVNPD
jgi:hypothetical protein